MDTPTESKPRGPRSIRVDGDLDAWILDRAERAGVSWSEYVRQVVEQYRLRVDAVSPLPTLDDVQASRAEGDTP